jgi:UDP-N-acetylmuramate--alanine ligase
VGISNNINRVYFIGAGGIGMSALARYFNYRKFKVAGYDLTPTPLTYKLMSEGIDISFSDDPLSVEAEYPAGTATEDTLVVYTPAIPSENNILRYFKTNGFRMVKRSVLLGELVNDGKGIAIAGTHGKTSVSVLTAHLLNQSPSGCNAFLGGISKNYESNLMVSEKSDLFVVEADEYDRSFLQLFPHIAVITSIDADHLDVYGSFSEMKSAFSAFASQVKSGGTIIYKKGLEFETSSERDVDFVSYGMEKGADYHALNIRIPGDGLPVFDLVSPHGEYRNLKLGIPGRFNVENAVAATAAAMICGMSEEEIKRGLENFKGVNRRFEIRINTDECVLIDDYAHHPAKN